MRLDRRLLLLSPATALPLVKAPQGPARQTAANMSGSVALRSHGAALDGITNDSGALQLAVNECLQSTPARPLVVDGPCRLERPVFIDRPVDRTRGVFRIVGEGSFGGFLAAGNFPLFDSRLTHPTAPLSEHVWFENVRFEALAAARLAMALSDKFLRVQFHDCEFEGIKAVSGKRYAQEWQFSRCIAQRWSGPFFSSHGGYHVTSTGSKFQNGGGHVFEIVEPALQNAGCVGCSFHQNITEANAGAFLKAAIVQGLSIAGLYSEGNSGSTLDFDNAAPNRGISVSGSFFAPQDQNNARPDFFDILWGRIEAGFASGNFSTGQLHHHRAPTPSALTIQGDYAKLKLVHAAR